MLDPPDAVVEALLQARARVNRYPERALGVTSTFVSEDARMHTVFVERMRGLLSRADMQTPTWRRLVKVTEAGITQFLPTTSCDLANFIRCLTFHVWVLGVLKPDDPSDRRLLSGHHLTVEQITNAFFSVSETGNTSVSSDQIRGALGQWIPDHDDDNNPVNLVFPVYEKLWRLVAATVLCSQGYSVSKNPLLDFCENPTRRQFETSRGTDQGPSATDIMNEVLRLHPPVQEIWRQCGHPWWETLVHGRMQVADIKAVQKFDEAGEVIEEPNKFVPERWRGERKPVMFAFGSGQLKCPADPWAQALAALIASKVTDRVDGMAFTLEKIGGTPKYIWDGWLICRLPSN
ncbi:hypothetical protein J3A83DRAFT_4099955 [Scleroderma citrinum]